MSINLEQGETLIMTVRRHWLLYLAKVAVVLISFALPLVMYGYASAATGFVLPDSYYEFFFFGWGILCWTKLFGLTSDYYLDSWVLTNKRLITIDQRGFFNRAVGNLRLERIQDVTAEVEGVISTLIDFGSIRVETAGDEEDFVIHFVPHPKHFKEMILTCIGGRLDRGFGVGGGV